LKALNKKAVKAAGDREEQEVKELQKSISRFVEKTAADLVCKKQNELEDAFTSTFEEDLTNQGWALYGSFDVAYSVQCKSAETYSKRHKEAHFSKYKLTHPSQTDKNGKLINDAETYNKHLWGKPMDKAGMNERVKRIVAFERPAEHNCEHHRDLGDSAPMRFAGVQVDQADLSDLDVGSWKNLKPKRWERTSDGAEDGKEEETEKEPSHPADRAELAKVTELADTWVSAHTVAQPGPSEVTLDDDPAGVDFMTIELNAAGVDGSAAEEQRKLETELKVRRKNLEDTPEEEIVTMCTKEDAVGDAWGVGSRTAKIEFKDTADEKSSAVYCADDDGEQDHDTAGDQVVPSEFLPRAARKGN